MISFYTRSCTRGVVQSVRRFDLQTTVGILLAAVMLLAAVAPPGRIHAHDCGEVICDLDQPHPHGHHHHAGHHSDVARDGVRSRTASYIHLVVGLFECSWPIHEEAQRVEDRLTGFRRWADDFVPSPCYEVDRRKTHTPPDWFDLAMRGALPMRQLTAPPGVAVPLCDVARQERSGVQRI